MWPVIAGGAALLTLGYLAMTGKAHAKTVNISKPKAKVDTVPRAEPVFKAEPSVPPFRPDESKPGPVEGRPLTMQEIQVLHPGAIEVATNPTGSKVIQKPDGGLVTVLPEITIIGQPFDGASVLTASQGMVNTTKGPLNVRGTPNKTGVIKGNVNKGTIVDITGPIVRGDGSQKAGWAPIKQGGITGYSSADYLEIA